jgi:hypothetical protein
MTRTTLRSLMALVACAPLWLVGCGNSDLPRRAAPAIPLEQTFKEQGDYEVHFNALRTDLLTQDVARAYGITRSNNRVLLNVAILKKEAPNTPRKPVEGNVQVDAYNLNGQLKNLAMRRVSEGDAIYYIGDVSISGTEILVFDIAVTPAGESTPIEAKFKREFDSK